MTSRCGLPFEIRWRAYLLLFHEEIEAGEFVTRRVDRCLFGTVVAKCSQAEQLVERGDVGNFINLPYFDSNKRSATH